MEIFIGFRAYHVKLSPGWWAGIIAAPLSGLVRVIILIILANIRAGFICLRVLNLSVVIIPTHYRVPSTSKVG